MTAVLEYVGGALQRIFGSRNQRLLNAMDLVVERIHAIERGYASLAEADFPRKTQEFKDRLKAGETLDGILPEAFALVREACRRLLGRKWQRAGEEITWDMVPFDVQLKGGMVLHQGKIAEMATGEGKTLVATMPAYLNALTGRNVHVITVNDYLARRDRDWMAPVYECLGLTVGAIQSEMDSAQRIPQYRCDITYGTNSEFGFDYLRDNMKLNVEEQCQRERYYAILDEVDNILIDEARTPLIISGTAFESAARYYQANRAAKRLEGMDRLEFDRRHAAAVRDGENKDAARERIERECDYIYSEKDHTVTLTDRGIARAQEFVGVEDFYAGGNTHWEHVITQALRAKELYKRDRDYVVQDGEVIIVDEFTGRLMHGRTWSEGLHQAVEAKENLKIKQETQTLATITYQNFFRLYEKLAGMTGTAMTEAQEFDSIYKLEVVTVPTNRVLRRIEYSDLVYRTAKEKWKAIVEEIVRIHESGKPILVGTISIEKSEMLSERLKRRGIKHEVLNAKQHQREAMIVAQAGQAGMVTIATNMAGRGTDIKLGRGVVETECLTPPTGQGEGRPCPHEPLCGLHIIGTERHEARRIDNQLRGRAGRQGDPGASRFFLSLEDDLMRLFAGEWVSNLLRRLGMGEDMPIESRMVSRRIRAAQRKVEERNFNIRKNLLDYDGVMDEQRKIIYTQRQEILESKGLKEMVLQMIDETVENAVDEAFERKTETDEWDTSGLSTWLRSELGLVVDPQEFGRLPRAEVAEAVQARVRPAYDEKEQRLGPDAMRQLERFLLLQALDTHWKDHLYAMDQLKGSIGLRGYAQVDPKVEYKREAYEIFSEMVAAVKAEVTGLVFKVQVAADEAALGALWNITTAQHSEFDGYAATRAAMQEAIARDQSKEEKVVDPIRREGPKVGRNDPCPCGSGKKYKRCCGSGRA
jgi:preprotein translocase subunit SecA